MSPTRGDAAILGDTPGQTYAAYAALGPLPLPSLEDTARRYLESVEPLVDAAGFAEAQAAMEALLEPGGLGRRLHAKLEEKAARSDNWLADWWDDEAYLNWSQPVVINCNFGINCDPRGPAQDPYRRAAAVAARTIDFHLALVHETLPGDTAGKAKTPLDMSFFRRILATVRTPGAVSDEIITYPPEASRHIVVMRRGRMYALDVLDASGRERAASAADLAAQFQRMVAAADAAGDAPHPVAALTAERRPVWAHERAQLLADPVNARSVRAIESALFVVCFDTDEFTEIDASARNALMGSVGARWHDKTFSWVVDAGGRVSQHGEHSTADGMQHISIIDYAAAPMDAAIEAELAAAPKADAPEPRALEWRLAPDTVSAIAAAAAFFTDQTENIDLKVLRFEDFGKSVIKTLGTGPDPFVQMAYQLAFRRLHGRTPKVYESAQTRAFKLGRTETIRSATRESRAFTEAFDDPAVSDADKVALLRAAFAKHAELGKLASNGAAVDRHLLGLRLIAQELGETEPLAFATQEVYGRGWELSTAQLVMKALMVNGFGPVTAAGYGIGYVIQDDAITCHVTSFRSHPETSSPRFVETLAQGFREIRALIERVG